MGGKRGGNDQLSCMVAGCIAGKVDVFRCKVMLMPHKSFAGVP